MVDLMRFNSPMRRDLLLLLVRLVDLFSRDPGETSASTDIAVFHEQWWAESLECYRYSRHVQDFVSNGRLTRSGRQRIVGE